MIKVIHILPRTPVGGVGAFLRNVQSNLNSNEIAFDYLIIEDVEGADFIQFAKDSGSEVILINECLKMSNSFRIGRKIEKELRNHHYDIAHLHSANVASLVFPVCKKCGINVRVLHSHSTRYSDGGFKSIRNFLLELPMFLSTTNYIACSKAAGDFLFKGKKYFTLYNGVDTERYNFAEKHSNSDIINIGHVGNFVEVKNHKYLIKIFEKLCEKYDNYRLRLFGDGKLIDSIKELVRERGLNDKVSFLGRVPNMQDYYSDIDILLLPSFYEGFPVAAMEAQACGIPVIASDTVTREIDFFADTHFCGIDDENIDQWIEAITSIKLSVKREKAQAFQKSIFTAKETANQLNVFYKKCLEGKDTF